MSAATQGATRLLLHSWQAEEPTAEQGLVGVHQTAAWAIGVAHRGPVKLDVQVQEKVPGALLQEPPFWQGLVGKHSLMSVEQEASVQPGRQLQVPVLGLALLVQVAPLRQGLVAQKSIKVWHCLPPQPGRQVHLYEVA